MATRIICDTNVWYQLGRHGISGIKQFLPDSKLLITQLTYFELITTHNIDSNFNIVKDANIAIQKHGTFIIANDIQHVLRVFETQFIEYRGVDCKEIMLNINREIINADSSINLQYNYDEVSVGRREAAKRIAEQINNFIVDNLKKKMTEDTFRHFVAYCLRRDTLLYLCRHRVVLKHHLFRVLSLNAYKKYFPLYINAFAGFLFTVYNKRKKKIPMKVSENDYIDFRNLIYCTGECKYLTLESTSGNRIGGMLKKHGNSYVYEHTEKIRTILNVL